MCLSADDFMELCDLYPSTCDSLKIQGLKKRKMFMNCLQLQEDEAKVGKKTMTSVIYKGHMKAHSKYRDILTSQLELEDDEMSMNPNNATCISSQVLHPDEQDMDQPDEKMEEQLEVTQNALKKMMRVMKVIQPIIHDLKTGSLKRVSKSTYVKIKRHAQDSDFENDLIVEEGRGGRNSKRPASIPDSDTSEAGIIRHGDSDTSGITHKSKQQRDVGKIIDSARESARESHRNLLMSTDERLIKSKSLQEPSSMNFNRRSENIPIRSQAEPESSEEH